MPAPLLSGHHPTDRYPEVDGRLTVALDGPGSSGKSSVGAAAARDVGYRFCDTGLLYRAVTWLPRPAASRWTTRRDSSPSSMRWNWPPTPRAAWIGSSWTVRTTPADVRSPAVDSAVSAVSAVPEVRAALLERQRHLAASGGIVMAGRDIGTVVLPDADLKIFLDASVEERARRRAEERGVEPGSRRRPGHPSTRSAVAIDSTRPRRWRRCGVAPDARIVTTDGNEFEDTVAAVVGAIRDAEARHG